MRTALLLLGAFLLLLAGCDHSGPTPSVTSISVDRLTVLNLPEHTAAGNAWDPSSGPDVFVSLRDPIEENALYTSPLRVNVSNEGTFAVAPDVTLDYTRNFRVLVFEEDYIYDRDTSSTVLMGQSDLLSGRALQAEPDTGSFSKRISSDRLEMRISFTAFGRR